MRINKGVEIDFIVSNTLEAIVLYKGIFDLEVIEQTDLEKGQNEVVFSIYGTQFHMLDENTEFNMVAPKKGDNSIWYNVTVDDIKKTYQKAISLGCTEIMPITEYSEHGILTSMFSDCFGLVWQLHQKK
ncbi:MerR family transcriptional regulator [Carnobacterium maltaromaticum]|uniref:VOC family protein n=1 Tax=Carnobacterium maltaromaticum TaxID=2751 RepID=UPI000C75C67D|nr:VOC family protein [Carnobacterium maltaromaticum]PLS32569.1 MerR family transcriptional regulator [Carnobacterium maltaromaticum]PLS32749.1 MerR family transcriptional regulator [Carnobacterium maltaromaticum]PLS33335.1 MerR family transcriptional regulator [Carnobacterium maltaromaticum]PLS40736.1 MerR family transcriptional regulator [Carnobacterium maltaromaticum]PLS41132.1 MerR family transcriptional regulator [Carnobacterium maltaromaticum]